VVLTVGSIYQIQVVSLFEIKIPPLAVIPQYVPFVLVGIILDSFLTLNHLQFSSSLTVTPQSSQSNLRKQASVIPAAPRNSNAAARAATAKVFFFFLIIKARSYAPGI